MEEECIHTNIHENGWEECHQNISSPVLIKYYQKKVNSFFHLFFVSPLSNPMSTNTIYVITD